MICKICGHEIPNGAKKCTECGEFQALSWRVLAGFDLKGLLALLPLLALIYGFLEGTLERESSEVKLTPISCGAEIVTIFASNVGNRNALLSSAGFAVGSGEMRLFTLPDESSDRVFEAGTSQLLTFRVDPERNPGGLVQFKERNNESCEVVLQFSIVQFDHSRSEKRATCACPSS